MNVIYTLLLITALLTLPNKALSVNWQVAPTLCISQYLDDVCQLNINVQLFNTQQQPYCTLFATHPLACWSDEQRREFKLTVEQQAPLTLLNEQGELQQQLQIKRKASKYRRRIKAPWSLL